jgi:hypothetical protein
MKIYYVPKPQIPGIAPALTGNPARNAAAPAATNTKISD